MTSAGDDTVMRPSPGPFCSTAVLGVALFKLPILLWLVWHALPMPISDAILFRQGAFEYLRDGRFAVPCAEGRLPYATELYGFYPPGYAYMNAAAYAVAGYSYPIALCVDAAIHTILMLLGARLLWELTPSVPMTCLFLLVTTVLWQTPGRPDELGTLFTLAALALRIISQRDDGCVAGGITSALTLAVATSPSDGLLGYVAVVVYGLLNPGGSTNRFRPFVRLTIIAVAVPLLSGPAFQFRYLDAWAQFQANAEFRYRPGVLELLKTITWTPFFVIHAGLAAYFLYVERNDSTNNPQRRALRATALTAFALIVPCLLMRRPNYGYLLCEILLLASCYAAFGRAATESRTASMLRFALGVLSLLAAAPLGASLVLNAVAPLLWDNRAITYEECRKQLASHIPMGSRMGGDGPMCHAAPQDPPVVSLRYAASEEWPQYVVSSYTMRGRPAALTRSSWKEVLDRDYELVYAPSPPNPHRLLGRFGFADNFGDWKYAVWRRKAPVNGAP